MSALRNRTGRLWLNLETCQLFQNRTPSEKLNNRAGW
jgi:hypothetical protein